LFLGREREATHRTLITSRTEKKLKGCSRTQPVATDGFRDPKTHRHSQNRTAGAKGNQQRKVESTLFWSAERHDWATLGCDDSWCGAKRSYADQPLPCPDDPRIGGPYNRQEL